MLTAAVGSIHRDCRDTTHATRTHNEPNCEPLRSEGQQAAAEADSSSGGGGSRQQQRREPQLRHISGGIGGSGSGSSSSLQLPVSSSSQRQPRRSPHITDL